MEKNSIQLRVLKIREEISQEMEKEDVIYQLYFLEERKGWPHNLVFGSQGYAKEFLESEGFTENEEVFNCGSVEVIIKKIITKKIS